MSDHERLNAAAEHNPSAGTDLMGQLVELTAVTGGLAHEIRNPLSTLRVNLQLLGEDWRDIAAGRVDDPGLISAVARRSTQRVETLIREVDRLAQLMDNFVRFVGRHELSPARVDLNELIAELGAFFEPQAARGGVKLTVEAAGAPVFCRVDANLFNQALLNLLINAQQAMPNGGELKLRCLRAGDHARVEVSDSGPGIPAELQGRIFEPYFSTRKGGTGLGLPVTRRIVNRHGGRVSIESRAGLGATFVVDVPAVD